MSLAVTATGALHGSGHYGLCDKPGSPVSSASRPPIGDACERDGACDEAAARGIAQGGRPGQLSNNRRKTHLPS